MTRRYFIECPLEAALAAKNHGFRFTHDGDNECDIIALIAGGIFVNFWNIKLYLHPDSLPLLDARIGDLTDKWDGYSHQYELMETEEDIEMYNSWAGDKFIEKRNGKPFPEVQWEVRP